MIPRITSTTSTTTTTTTHTSPLVRTGFFIQLLSFEMSFLLLVFAYSNENWDLFLMNIETTEDRLYSGVYEVRCNVPWCSLHVTCHCGGGRIGFSYKHCIVFLSSFWQKSDSLRYNTRVKRDCFCTGKLFSIHLFVQFFVQFFVIGVSPSMSLIALWVSVVSSFFGIFVCCLTRASTFLFFYFLFWRDVTSTITPYQLSNVVCFINNDRF